MDYNTERREGWRADAGAEAAHAASMNNADARHADLEAEEPQMQTKAEQLADRAEAMTDNVYAPVWAELSQALIDGDGDTACRLANEALEAWCDGIYGGES
jgi:hypothetical protein